eukprot:836702-Pyramimonas_sp.AAC.1
MRLFGPADLGWQDRKGARWGARAARRRPSLAVLLPSHSETRDSVEARDSVDAGPLDRQEYLSVVPRDSAAAGESYDKTSVVSNISRSADRRVELNNMMDTIQTESVLFKTESLLHMSPIGS